MNETTVREKLEFKVGDLVVCPAHGFGKIIEITEEDIFGTKVKFYIISIKARDMVVRIPVAKVDDSGVRHINNTSVVEKILEYLAVPYEQSKKVMWNKRHLLYEERANSSDLFEVLSVVKDLYHSKNKADEQLMTFSEKNIYKVALEKVSNEVALILNITQEDSEKIIFDALAGK